MKKGSTLLMRISAPTRSALPLWTLAACSSARPMIRQPVSQPFPSTSGSSSVGQARWATSMCCRRGRHRGIARLLVAAAETFLREHGASGYQVTITPYGSREHGLEHFYRRLGFASEGG